MKRISTLTLLLILSTFLSAQKQFFLKPSEVSLSNSISWDNKKLIDQDNIERLFPKEDFLSDELIQNLNNKEDYYGVFQPNDYILGINMGFNILNRKANSYYKSPVFRLGFQYRSVAPMVARSEERYETRIDTLISLDQNSTVFVDSVQRNTLNLGKYADVIALDASLIFRTDSTSWFSFFGGGGISAGVSFNSYTLANLIEQDFVNLTGNYSVDDYSEFKSANTWENTQEKRENDVNLMAAIYFPIGFDIRLGQQSSFLRRLHIFYEARPEINFFSIPEVSTISNFRLIQGVGLRFRLN